MIHGCFGQLFFAYLAALTAWSSRAWGRLGATDDIPPASRKIRDFSFICLAAVYGQIVVGAWLRHFQSPDKLYLHGIFGLLVVVLLTVFGKSVRSESFDQDRAVRRTRTAMVGLTHMQWVLGLVSWWLMRPFDGIPKVVTDAAAIVRTAHQANGALVLAFTTVMTLWIVRASRTAASSEAVQSPAQKLEAACQS
jgi:cytochrome c oxidase assembly protein subunit 15